MNSNWVTLIVGALGFLGAYLAFKENWRSSDIDIMKELRETNNALKEAQQENLELREKINDLGDIIDKQNDTIKDLKNEISLLRLELYKRRSKQ